MIINQNSFYKKLVHKAKIIKLLTSDLIFQQVLRLSNNLHIMSKYFHDRNGLLQNNEVNHDLKAEARHFLSEKYIYSIK